MGRMENLDVIDFGAYRQIKAALAQGRSVQIGKVVFGENARIPAEGYAAHKEDEYTCVLRGTIAFGTEEGTCHLHPGDLHYLPRGVGHWCQSVDSGEGELLYILVK